MFLVLRILSCYRDALLNTPRSLLVVSNSADPIECEKRWLVFETTCVARRWCSDVQRRVMNRSTSNSCVSVTEGRFKDSPFEYMNPGKLFFSSRMRHSCNALLCTWINNMVVSLNSCRNCRVVLRFYRSSEVILAKFNDDVHILRHWVREHVLGGCPTCLLFVSNRSTQQGRRRSSHPFIHANMAVTVKSFRRRNLNAG